MDWSLLWFLWHDLRGSRATKRPWTLGYHAPPSSCRSFFKGWQSPICLIRKVCVDTHQHQLLQTEGKPEDCCQTGYKEELEHGWRGRKNHQIGTVWMQRRKRWSQCPWTTEGGVERRLTHITHKPQVSTLVWRCTWTMAGSWGNEHVGLGGSHTVRSLISLPLKMMYSKISSRARMGLSVGRSSVPKDRTERKGRRFTN